MKSSFHGHLIHYLLGSYVICICISRALHSAVFAKYCTHCFRLPDTLEPIIYDLKLTLNSDLEYISGQVLIEIQCKQNTSLIQLHGNSLFLNIQHATLENRLTNETIDLKSPMLNWRDEVIEFRLEEWPLKHATVYYLQIWYTTRYADDGHGLMRHQDLERGIWINSLFEPVFARRLLPCFDEPRWRTAFKLELWLIGEFAHSSFTAFQLHHFLSTFLICHWPIHQLLQQNCTAGQGDMHLEILLLARLAGDGSKHYKGHVPLSARND
uniref:Aminopeptidase N-like N-terminal domain-containing protein n=1 Tax=Ditylenchus dipsaci TaxID=166011 RepID=A0A915DVK9_9BILA